MSHLGLTLLLLVLSMTLTCLDSAPADRLKIRDETSEKGWTVTLQGGPLSPNIDRPLLRSSRHRRSQMEKRKCNTATCVTQRLADFLVRSSNSLAPIYAPTNVGSYTYGKRDIVGLLQRESIDYLQH